MPHQFTKLVCSEENCEELPEYFLENSGKLLCKAHFKEYKKCLDLEEKTLYPKQGELFRTKSFVTPIKSSWTPLNMRKLEPGNSDSPTRQLIDGLGNYLWKKVFSGKKPDYEISYKGYEHFIAYIEKYSGDIFIYRPSGMPVGISYNGSKTILFTIKFY